MLDMQKTLSSIGVKKDLPFTKFLNYELNKLRESGILQNILVNPKDNCPLDENPKAITFSKLVFYLPSLFLVGYSQSLSLFLKELFQTRKMLHLKKFMEINETRSKEEILKPMKLEFSAIWVNQLLLEERTLQVFGIWRNFKR